MTEEQVAVLAAQKITLERKLADVTAENQILRRNLTGAETENKSLVDYNLKEYNRARRAERTLKDVRAKAEAWMSALDGTGYSDFAFALCEILALIDADQAYPDPLDDPKHLKTNGHYTPDGEM